MVENYSVLMSVYHKEKAQYLREAMQSIFDQTVLTDDFVLICDGPLTNELDDVINEMQIKYNDVLRVHRLKQNKGLGNALNIGLNLCKNELVARMDSDDISIRNRCELQIKEFETHPALALVSGTVLEFVDTPNKALGVRKLPETNKEIIEFSKKRNPFNHPATMFKKSLVQIAGGYNERFHLFEDYYLWIRMLMCGFEGSNLSKNLVYMRTPSDMYVRRGGVKYAREMLRFHYWMLCNNWSNISDYIFGSLPHAIICILPNNIRKIIYEKLHS